MLPIRRLSLPHRLRFSHQLKMPDIGRYEKPSRMGFYEESFVGAAAGPRVHPMALLPLVFSSSQESVRQPETPSHPQREPQAGQRAWPGSRNSASRLVIHVRDGT